jgi:hypothetical protein
LVHLIVHRDAVPPLFGERCPLCTKLLLIATTAFGEIACTDDCFVGTGLHILFSFRCVVAAVLSAEAVARVQRWRGRPLWAPTKGPL